MKSPQETEQLLETIGRDWPADASIVERVMHQIERDGVRPESPDRNRSRVVSLLALAAAVTIVAALWWILSPVDNSLYAQALRAIANARTIHKVTRVIPADDKPQIGIESWCERNVGFRVDLPHEIRLGNQRHLWTYRKKDKLVIRSDSPDINDLINRDLDLKQMLEELKQLGFKRYPECDQQVDGRPLRAYLLTKTRRVVDPAANSGKRRGVVLMDDQSRIVRAQQETRVGDRWVPNVVTDWQYDVPIDRGLFEPNFGGEVKIVDSGTAFDELVNLDKALYREERQGIIFAIHSLERFDDQGVLVMSSVRGAPATLKKYPLKQRRIQLGLYVSDGPADNLMTSPQGSGYFRIELASVSYQGIDVCWWVVVPRGTNAPPYEAEPGKVKLPVGFTPRGEFGKIKFADEQGVIQHAAWDALVELPNVKTPLSLDDIADRVYADMTALQGLPFRQLYLGVNPATKSLDVSSPDELSVAEYRSGTQRNVIEWYQRDLDFALTGQFTEEMRRQIPAWAGSSAISLSYNPLVDDFTLAEVAKRTSIERLYLNGTRITDAGLRELAPLVNLRELSLNDTPITDAGLKNLESLAALEKLYVHGTQITPAGIAKLVNAIPKLEVIR